MNFWKNCYYDTVSKWVINWLRVFYLTNEVDFLCSVCSISLSNFTLLLVAQKSPWATGSAQLAQSISQKHPTQGGDTLNNTAYVRRPVYSSTQAFVFSLWCCCIIFILNFMNWFIIKIILKDLYLNNFTVLLTLVVIIFNYI